MSHSHTKGKIKMTSSMRYKRNGTLQAIFSHSYHVHGVSRCRNGLSGSSKRYSRLTPEPSVLILLFLPEAIKGGTRWSAQQTELSQRQRSAQNFIASVSNVMCDLFSLLIEKIGYACSWRHPLPHTDQPTTYDSYLALMSSCASLALALVLGLAWSESGARHVYVLHTLFPASKCPLNLSALFLPTIAGERKRES